MSKNKTFYFKPEEFQVKDGFSVEWKYGRVAVINKNTDDRVEAIEGTLGNYFSKGFDQVYIGSHYKWQEDGKVKRGLSYNDDRQLEVFVYDSNGRISRQRAKELIQMFIDELVEGLK